MKLSKENIQSINRYLKHEQVVYFDIRMEMVDHVATAVEQKMVAENLDFYNAFKNYMISNKKELLQRGKINRGALGSKDVIKQFFIYLIRPYFLALAIVLFVVFSQISISNYFSDTFTVNNLFAVLIILVALFQIGYFYIYLKERFYYLERTSGILALIYYGQMFFLPTFRQETPSPYLLTFFTYVLIVYLVFFCETIVKFNKHKKKYI